MIKELSKLFREEKYKVMNKESKKLKVSWKPNINQDIDALTNENSPFYDKELTRNLLEKYGTIDDARKELIKQIKSYE